MGSPSASDAAPGPAGWYPDRDMVDTVRYWDGGAWTDKVAPAPSPVDESAGSVEESVKEEPAAKYAGVSCLSVIALVIVLFLIGTFSGDDTDEGTTYGAQSACEDFVKGRLKAPGTADFSNTQSQETATGWTVTGAVDSENSFGASLRMTYTCKVTYSGDSNWKLQDITVR